MYAAGLAIKTGVVQKGLELLSVFSVTGNQFEKVQDCSCCLSSCDVCWDEIKQKTRKLH